MTTTNLSIGSEAVIDFDCSGWAEEKRKTFFTIVREIQGVTNVNGAGISTMRVRFNPSIIDHSALKQVVNQAADDILSQHHEDGASIAWPFAVKLDLLGDPQAQVVVNIQAGINTLVGPNGSGKTRSLRKIKAALESSGLIKTRKIHFLAAGRSSPLEGYRAAVDRPGHTNQSDAAVGHIDYRRQWWQFESVTGALLALDARADLRLKIEARLQQLFDRSVKLSWSQQGLNIRISPVSGGSSYAANYEASGILQLVALLAAIHNDEIGALLIDEPEISLHPQHQAFLFEEMERVAGDPMDPARKLIIIATHSAALLPLRSVNDLPALMFFNSVRSAPAQVPVNADILKRTKLTALIARLSATHRLAMFAERVLLVEGPSDEIVATQLARRLELRLLARNAQILPVTGKGEFIEAAKLFRLMNKEVAVLADLDALVDDNSLVNAFSELPSALAIADRLGRSNIMDFDRDLRTDLAEFISRHSDAIQEAAAQYRDWSSPGSNDKVERRVTLARILTDPQSFNSSAASEANSLQTRYLLLIKALSELGCFFLHRGAIENYYLVDELERGKPDCAAQEAATFETTEPANLLKQYADLVAALVYIAPNQQIDEDLLLRPKLGAVLASVFLSMESDSTDERLNAIAMTTVGSDAEVFKLSNCSKQELRVSVEMASPLFPRDKFPFEIGREENLTSVIPTKLPGLGSP
ncbi:ATP-dependent nuclease [Alcaligenes faecalis]|uniref:AAA family ATPase n=1 Tax=Alcaligenes faecalis TaxID=511 RepID=A0AAE9KN53_ALCFA|nr:TOPRIM nucleotidyl transferase/hydrolase domain-containing protein [Alcaligenes faecalis]UPL19895.1 AAA family ATPase [Alcaligenes faecalis]